jgi:hypothetical protein
LGIFVQTRKEEQPQHLTFVPHNWNAPASTPDNRCGFEEFQNASNFYQLKIPKGEHKTSIRVTTEDRIRIRYENPGKGFIMWVGGRGYSMGNRERSQTYELPYMTLWFAKKCEDWMNLRSSCVDLPVPQKLRFSTEHDCVRFSVEML